MKYRLKVLVIFVFSVILVSLAFIMLGPERVGLCGKMDLICMNKYSVYDSFTAPIFLFSVASSLLSFMLMFFAEASLVAWLKFSAIWIPVSFLLISQTPEFTDGWALSFAAKQDVLWLTSIGYLVISLIIIVRAHNRIHKQAVSR